MIQTIHLDDEKVIRKKDLKETVRHIRYIGKIEPEGYISSEEFRKLAIAKINKFCDEHGVL